jgi:hypothetical protein
MKRYHWPCLVVLLVVGCTQKTPEEMKWSKVEALRLPGASLAEITLALGPVDDDARTDSRHTTYAWYRFLPRTNDSPMNSIGWNMLEVTVDNAGNMVHFRRLKPFILDNGTIYPVDVDQAYRDKQGKWHSGPLPAGGVDNLSR